MSFQALARKWRPRRFDQLVGQEHVVRALTHALDSDQLHHALLFSGTRGVGKTTLARIIAKCLNCEYGVSATPCTDETACSTCREIDEGRYVDLIEVDAASRTGVDDTRELMDNVQYAPTRGRTKVYLIDEVHMLTKHSFNALLKTLEEPPPRVQFLLATTEPEKIPVTILSRCLQFPLKRLGASRIASRLRYIVDAESLSADDQALEELARGADGSMRDGLSLLDQAIAFGGGHLDVDGVRDMLGTIGEARVAELVEAIIEARPTDTLIALEALYSQGIDMDYLLGALATAWQHIATIQIVGEAVDDDSARWQAVAAQAAPHLIQVFYDITLAGRRDLTHAPDPLVGVKMTILRMLAFMPGQAAVSGQAAATDGQSSSSTSNRLPSAEESPARSAREAMARARAQLQEPAGANNQPTRTDAGPAASPDSDSGKKNTDVGLAPSASSADAPTPEPAAASPTASAAPLPAAEENEPENSELSQSGPPPSNASDTPEEPPPAEMPPWLLEAELNLPGPGQAGPPAQPEPAAEPASAAISATPLSEASFPAPSESEQAAPDESEPVLQEALLSDAPPSQSSSDAPSEAWHELLPKLELQGFAAQLANHASCRQLDTQMVELTVARTNILLVTEDAQHQLQQALARFWNMTAMPPLKIHAVDQQDDTPARRREADAEQRQQDAVASMENDPIIEQLRSQLGARLRVDTIKPHRLPGAMDNRDPS